MEKEKKNIIIIVIDALRPKNLSLFGYDKQNDKNMCKIAGESFVFKKNFSSSNSTTPSLTSIFTGLYPKNHGIFHQLPYTKQEEIDNFYCKNLFWLPEFLKKQGYETIAIDWLGMWFKKGFDYYDDGMDFDSLKKAPFNSAEEITKLAISKIEGSTKPFFLFLHFWETHFPFPHTSYEIKEKQNAKELAINKIKNENQKEYFKKRMKGNLSFTFKDLINKYDLAIKSVDEQIGNIYDFLKNKNLLDESIIFILGDHGTNLTEHGTYFSSSGLYDDSINTLLMIRFPGKLKEERTQFVQDVDIAPTILDFLSEKIPDNLDGKSLIPLIEEGELIRNHILSHDGLCENIKCARNEKKKFILAENNSCYLCKGNHHKESEEYDLEIDPEERENIYSGDSELKKFLDY